MAKHKISKSKKQRASTEPVPGVNFEETPIEDATPVEAKEPVAEAALEGEKAPSEAEEVSDIAEEFDETFKASLPRPEVEVEQKIEEGEPVRLTISVPVSVLDEDGWARFERAVKNKDQMFRHAFDADELKIEREGDVVSLPWFKLADIKSHREAAAYSDFVSKLIIYARESKRVLDLSENKPSDNEKFSMRVFMIRLNMKGERYASARRILMRRLTGNSSFRYGDPRKRVKAVEEAEVETPVVSDPEPVEAKSEV